MTKACQAASHQINELLTYKLPTFCSQTFADDFPEG